MRNKRVLWSVFFIFFSTVISPYIFSQNPPVLDNTVFEIIEEDLRKVPEEHVAYKIKKIQRLNRAGMEDIQHKGIPGGNAFYPAGSQIDISQMNGKNGTLFLNEKEIRKVIRQFEIYRKDDVSLASFKIPGVYAYEWWVKNIHINYNPLLVTLVNYATVDLKEKTVKGGKKDFFALYPFDSTVHSQVISFGFEKEFYYGNELLKVDRIILTCKGKQYTLIPSSCVPVVFDGEGEHMVNAEVRFSDNSVYKTSFRILCEKEKDGEWFNSTVDEHGNVRFRMKFIK